LIDFDDTPIQGKNNSHKSKSIVSDESDSYIGSTGEVSDGEDTDDAAPPTAADKLLAIADEARPKNQALRRTSTKDAVPKDIADTSSANHNDHEVSNLMCSLCGIRHGDGACYMTESSENLAEYRQMLILHADDEPVEDRVIIYILLYIYQLTMTLTYSKRPSESLMRRCTSGGNCT
jgi:hypothetical protein